jgi:hypothetical protein
MGLWKEGIKGPERVSTGPRDPVAGLVLTLNFILVAGELNDCAI